MANYQDAKELTQLTLGKATEYTDQYNPKLLQPVPRSLNRNDLNLTAPWPFTGQDVWYGYELSWLNAHGKPVVAIAEFIFDCFSENLVESKSFKLYLNSFNQTRFSSWQEVSKILERDLTNTAKGKTSVTLFPVDDCDALQLYKNDAIKIDDLEINIDSYQYDANILNGSINNSNELVTEHLVSHLLKSNCLITNQPDWASIYIKYTGHKINHEKLLRYIISFRQHNEFHEQCVERIFCDIMKFCQCQSLSVFARYTRRGGLDINPYRTTGQHKATPMRTIRQ